MNPRLLLGLSVALNVLFAAYLIREAVTSKRSATIGSGPLSEPLEPSTSEVDGLPSERLEDRDVEATPARRFNWEAVESPDYREYVANLRSIGCPEETIRDIIFADVTKLYDAKRRALRGEAKRFEYWKPGNPWGANLNAESLAEHRALEQEKMDVLQQLGIEPDARMQMDSFMSSAVYLDDMLSFLPDEKQVMVMRIMQDMQAEMAESAADGMALDAVEVMDAQRQMEAGLREVLTPEEFLDYELRMSVTANTMRSQLAGWDPDEQEFLEVFELRKAFDDEFGPYQTGNETEEERRQRAAAEEKLTKAIRDVMGDDRYEAYERAQDYQFRQIYEVVQRAELGTEEAVQVYDMQRVAQQEAAEVRGDPQLSSARRNEILEGIRAETERSIRAVLGDEGWDQYNRPQNTYWLNNMAVRDVTE